MGLFDSLPAPSKPTSKRVAGSVGATSDDSGNKKPRQDGISSSSAPAEHQASSGAGGSGSGRSLAWTGSLEAAFSEDKGSRLTMEDVAVINTNAGSASTSACRLSFFGIFDGHGGSAVARYAADNLHACVMEAGVQREVERLAAAAVVTVGGTNAGGLPAAQIKQCKAAIAGGFRELDRQVMDQCAAAGWQDGCTAVTVWVVGNTVFVANVGDARCVLARRPQKATGEQAGRGAGTNAAQQADGEQQVAAASQQPASLQAPAQPQPQPQPPQQQQGQQQQAVEPLKAITLTREHKAIFPLERQRIEQAGSFVSGDGRLAGRVEVSRAFGDRLFKKQGMIAVPDVQAFQLSERDVFLLLACDGFWGVYSPQDAVGFAQRELVGKGHGVKQTCNRLVYSAIRERYCKDNCTVMMVMLGGL